MSTEESNCKHTYEIKYAIFDAYFGNGRSFKFFMPSNVCTQCKKRISGVPNDHMFFYNAISVVINAYSEKFKN